MPGANAHMTLVNILRDPIRLVATPGFTDEAISALLEYFRFTEIGAVSPDYPYLAIGDSNAAQWADAMHYTHTGAMIQAGVEADPSVETVMKGVEFFNREKPDLIIGRGGCSAINAAKAMWVFYEYPEATFEEIIQPFTIKPLRNKNSNIS